MSDKDQMVSAMERMNNLLALVAVKGIERKDAVLTLLRAGCSQTEIGSLLEMKGSAVGMIVLRHRQGKKAKKGTGGVKSGNG